MVVPIDLRLHCATDRLPRISRHVSTRLLTPKITSAPDGNKTASCCPVIRQPRHGTNLLDRVVATLDYKILADQHSMVVSMRTQDVKNKGAMWIGSL
jgi:hypothetical protein